MGHLHALLVGIAILATGCGNADSSDQAKAGQPSAPAPAPTAVESAPATTAPSQAPASPQTAAYPTTAASPATAASAFASNADILSLLTKPGTLYSTAADPDVTVDTAADSEVDASTPVAAGAVPADVTVDLRRFDLTIKKQGQRKTCTSFATIAALENALNQSIGSKTLLSEEDLWSRYAAPKLAAALAAAATPIVPEAAWPYGTQQPATLPSGVAQLANARKLSDASAALAALQNGEGVTIAIGSSAALEHAGPVSGVIRYEPGMQRSGGHDLAVVGITFNAQAPGGGWFIVKNSWGAAWGDHGYGYLAMDYCSHLGCTIAAFTAVSTPTP